jgi:hypothetical protein
MKLQSMTDFVLSLDITEIKQRNSIINYANFLKQPLTLGMFIPCDLEGNMLGKQYTKNHLKSINYDGCIDDYALKYKEAKERVLFKGFEILYQDSEDNCIQDKSKQAFIFDRKTKLCQSDDGEDLKTIEDLVKYNLELTDSVIKKANEIYNNKK